MDRGRSLQIHRKPESEGAALAKFARDLQRRAVFIDDGFADRKSEASTSGRTSSRFVGTVKAVKNLRQMLFGDAAPVSLMMKRVLAESETVVSLMQPPSGV